MTTFPARTCGLGILAVLAISSPAPAEDEPKEPATSVVRLFPLKKGVVWGSNMASGPKGEKFERGAYWESKVGGLELIGKEPSCRVQTDKPPMEVALLDNQVWYSTGAYCEYHSLREDGLYIIATSVAGKIRECEPRCVLKSGKQTTQSWEGKGRANKEFWPTEHAYTYRYVQYNDTVTLDKVETSCVTVVETRAVHLADVPEYNRAVMTERAVLVTKTCYVPDRGPVYQEYHVKNADGKNKCEPRPVAVRAKSGLGVTTYGPIVINPKEEESDTPVAVDRYRLQPGDEAEFERKRTITREATFTIKGSVGVEVGSSGGLNLAVVKGELSGKVKAAVEAELGDKLKDEESRTGKLIVRNKGNAVREGRIVWIDTYKTGSVEVTVDGKKHDVRFRFPIGTRMESRDSK